MKRILILLAISVSVFASCNNNGCGDGGECDSIPPDKQQQAKPDTTFIIDSSGKKPVQ